MKAFEIADLENLCYYLRVVKDVGFIKIFADGERMEYFSKIDKKTHVRDTDSLLAEMKKESEEI